METMHAAGRRRLPPVPRPAGDRQTTGQLTAERPDPVGTDGAQADTELIERRQIAAGIVEVELAAMAGAPAGRRGSGAPVAEPPRAEMPDADADTVPDDTDEHTDTALDDTARFEPVDALPEEPAEIAQPAAEQHPVEIPQPAAEQHAVEAAQPGPEQLVEVERPQVGPEEQVDVAEPDIESGRPPVDTPPEDHDPAQQFVTRLRSSAADFAGAAGAESAVVREAVPPARHRRARCRLVLRYADGTVTDVTLLGPAGRPGRPSRHGFDRQILRWLGSGLVRDGAWLMEDPDAPDGIAIDLTAWVAAG